MLNHTHSDLSGSRTKTAVQSTTNAAYCCCGHYSMCHRVALCLHCECKEYHMGLSANHPTMTWTWG